MMRRACNGVAGDIVRCGWWRVVVGLAPLGWVPRLAFRASPCACEQEYCPSGRVLAWRMMTRVWMFGSPMSTVVANGCRNCLKRIQDWCMSCGRGIGTPSSMLSYHSAPWWVLRWGPGTRACCAHCCNAVNNAGGYTLCEEEHRHGRYGCVYNGMVRREASPGRTCGQLPVRQALVSLGLPLGSKSSVGRVPGQRVQRPHAARNLSSRSLREEIYTGHPNRTRWGRLRS